MADEACEVRPAGNRERAFTRIDPNCNLLTQNILIILHDVIVVNNNLSILIRNDIPYWLISTYHQNCEDRFLVKSPWYQRLYTFSSPRNCIFFFTMAQLMKWEELTTGRGRATTNTAGNAKINEGNLFNISSPSLYCSIVRIETKVYWMTSRHIDQDRNAEYWDVLPQFKYK